MKRPLRQRGFTLIELMVVISIIGLLSALITAGLATARIRARNATIISNTHQAAIALETYYATYGTYPNPASATDALCIGAATCACPSAISSVCGSTITDQITMSIPGLESSEPTDAGSLWNYALFAPRQALAATYSGYGILTNQTLQDPLVYYCSYSVTGQCPEGYEWILYPQYSGSSVSSATWLNISPIGVVTNFVGGAE